MPPSLRYRVLLVDPVKLRRDRAASAARLRIDVIGAGSEAEAKAAVGMVHAVVLTLKQVDENGLVLAKKLREKFGAEPYFVVHGATMPPKSTEERAALAARHKVDLWLGNAIEPEGLEAAVWAELVRRFPPPKPPPRPAGTPEAAAADEEPSWGELLRAPATVDNVKKLLTKDIGGARRRP